MSEFSPNHGMVVESYYRIYPVVMATAKIYKLKDGSSRLDQDITGTKKPLSVTGALKSCYIMPKYGRCER